MILTADTAAIAREVRGITDAEVAFYETNGWVKLDQLIPPEFAAELLSRAKGYMGPNGDANVLRHGVDLVGHASWHDYHNIAEDDDAFAALAFNNQIGRNAQRL